MQGLLIRMRRTRKGMVYHHTFHTEYILTTTTRYSEEDTMMHEDLMTIVPTFRDVLMTLRTQLEAFIACLVSRHIYSCTYLTLNYPVFSLGVPLWEWDMKVHWVWSRISSFTCCTIQARISSTPLQPCGDSRWFVSHGYVWAICQESPGHVCAIVKISKWYLLIKFLANFCQR